jgi:hypothetical protein
MRTLSQLLVLLYITISKDLDFQCGLCYNVTKLFQRDLITYQEWHLLYRYIQDNRPKWYQCGYDKNQKDSYYFWPKNSKEPRLKWLFKHIDKQFLLLNNF